MRVDGGSTAGGAGLDGSDAAEEGQSPPAIDSVHSVDHGERELTDEERGERGGEEIISRPG